MTDQALLLPLVEWWSRPIFKRLLGLQHLIHQHQQSVRHSDEGGSFLASRFASDPPELLLEKTVLLGCRGPGAFG
jgi:hypothetical protein